MALTADDIKRFEQPLALEDHEARASGKNKDETKQQWLIYVTQEGIIPLLNSIDPNWTWDVRESSKWDKYAVVTGRLTIKDVFRDGRGGNSPNSKSASTDENTEKGAETDALKRAAVKFGIGLYLRSQPTIWVDITPNKPWEDEKTALAKFADWYKREFGAQNARNGQPPPQRPPNAPVPPVGGQNANPPNGLAPSTPASPSSADASAKAELFPDEPPVVEGAVVVKLPPQVGTIDMQALGKRAFDEKLVHGRNHFADLMNAMLKEGWLRDAMNADAVLEAIRKREADKDLAKEAVGK